MTRDLDASKVCSRCRVEQAQSEFGKRSPGSRGAGSLGSWCRSCCLEDKKERYKKNRHLLSERAKVARLARSDEERAADAARFRARALKREYNLTVEQWQAMFDAQGGRCGICKTAEGSGGGKRLAVDHDHRCCPGKRSCGECVRGLLCASCNQKIGFYEKYADLVVNWVGPKKETVDA